MPSTSTWASELKKKADFLEDVIECVSVSTYSGRETYGEIPRWATLDDPLLNEPLTSQPIIHSGCFVAWGAKYVYFLTFSTAWGERLMTVPRNPELLTFSHFGT